MKMILKIFGLIGFAFIAASLLGLSNGPTNHSVTYSTELLNKCHRIRAYTKDYRSDEECAKDLTELADRINNGR